MASLSFMDYLKDAGEDTSKVEQILKSKWNKTLDVIKEAYSEKYTNKEFALHKIQTEFVKNPPKTIDNKFLNENMKYIVEKLESLDEGEIKIIINNDVSKGGTPSVSYGYSGGCSTAQPPSSMTLPVVVSNGEGDEDEGDEQLECAVPKKRGRPSKKAIEEAAAAAKKEEDAKKTKKKQVMEDIEDDMVTPSEDNNVIDELGDEIAEDGTIKEATEVKMRSGYSSPKSTQEPNASFKKAGVGAAAPRDSYSQTKLPPKSPEITPDNIDDKDDTKFTQPQSSMKSFAEFMKAGVGTPMPKATNDKLPNTKQSVTTGNNTYPSNFAKAGDGAPMPKGGQLQSKPTTQPVSDTQGQVSEPKYSSPSSTMEPEGTFKRAGQGGSMAKNSYSQGKPTTQPVDLDKIGEIPTAKANSPKSVMEPEGAFKKVGTGAPMPKSPQIDKNFVKKESLTWADLDTITINEDETFVDTSVKIDEVKAGKIAIINGKMYHIESVSEDTTVTVVDRRGNKYDFALNEIEEIEKDNDVDNDEGVEGEGGDEDNINDNDEGVEGGDEDEDENVKDMSNVPEEGDKITIDDVQYIVISYDEETKVITAEDPDGEEVELDFDVDTMELEKAEKEDEDESPEHEAAESDEEESAEQVDDDDDVSEEPKFEED